MRISSKPKPLFRKMFRKLTLPAKPTSLSTIAAAYLKPGNTLLLPLAPPGDATFVMERADNKTIDGAAARLILNEIDINGLKYLLIPLKNETAIAP